MDIIRGELERVRAVRVECHGCAAVIRRDHDAFDCQRCLRCLGRLLSGFFRGYFVAWDHVSRDRHITVQRPDRFGHLIENIRILCGIIFAVRHLVFAKLVVCRSAHLAGIGIQLQFEHRMCCL